MIVNVSVLNTNVKMKVSVGDGYQSIKWLGSVVQTRIGNEKLLRHLNILDQVIVKSVKNGKGELLNPSDLILEHRPVDCDALDVTVDWMEEFQSDAWGHPIYEDWLQAAYMNSETSSKWAFESQTFRESEQHRIARDKEFAQFDDDVDGNPVLARMAMAKRKAATGQHSEEKNQVLDGGKPVGSSLVQIGSDFSAAEIEAAFTLDWTNMKFGWYKNITELNKIAIYDTMKENYSVICNLFVHYCGIGRVGERWGMSILEFEHLMTLATGKSKLSVQLLVDKVFGAVLQRKPGRSLKKEAAAVAEAARRAGEHDEDDDDAENDHASVHSMNSRSRANTVSRSTLKSYATSSTRNLEEAPSDPTFWPLLSRQMFAEFVVCFAYMDMQDNHIDDMSPAQAAELLLTTHLHTFLGKVRSSYLKYTEFDSFTMNESSSMLKEFYLKHASIDPYLGPHLSAPEFEHLMGQSQMLIEADGVKEKEQKVTEEAFLWALFNAPRPAEQAEDKPPTIISSYFSQQPIVIPDDGTLGLHDAICFSEFVEALSKLSVITMAHETTLPDLKKIRVGLNFLIEYYVTGSFDGLGGSDASVTKGTSKGLVKGAAAKRHPIGIEGDGGGLAGNSIMSVGSKGFVDGHSMSKGDAYSVNQRQSSSRGIRK